MSTLYLRPSGILAHDDCPKKYDYQYRQKVRSEATSVNLPFGTAVHESCTGYLASVMNNKDFDPEKVFIQEFEKKLASMIVEVPATKTIEQYRDMGRKLANDFPERWKEAGFDVLVDSNGKPLIERKLEYQVNDEIVLTGTPDVGVVDPEGNCGVIDIKTPASASDPLFTTASEQLTAYQLLLEANAQELAIGGVDLLGFFEGIKRKTDPQWLKPQTTAGRDNDQKTELVYKMLDIKHHHARGYFPRRPRMAYNSPCLMCDFRHWCHEGDDQGLVFGGGFDDEAEEIQIPEWI